MEQIYAYAYCRYSSHNQDDGWSIESQKAAIDKYAKNNGIKIRRYFVDEAMTGRNTNRPGYQKMMQTFQDNPDVKILLIHKLDRMHRKTINQLSDIDTLGKMGVRLVAIADGVDTNDNSFNLIATIKAALAEQYSLNLSAEVRKGLMEAAKCCMHTGGRPPYGFKVGDNRKLEIDEVTAPAVRRIFAMYIAGMGYSSIINWLNEHNYRTQDGNSFTKTSINSILHNEKYCGVYVYDKALPKDEDGCRNSHQYKENYLRIEGGCPAIISPDDFAAVQKKMKKNAKALKNYRAKRYYPLNGKIFLTNNKIRFSGTVNYSKKKPYYNYRCIKKGNKAINAPALEESVFCALRELLLADDREDAVLKALNQYAMEVHENANEDCRILKRNRAAAENKLSHLMQLTEQGNAPASVMERIKALEAEISALNTQIAQIQNIPCLFTSDDLIELKNRFVQYMMTQNTLEARNLIDAVIQKIEVDDENAHIRFNNGIPMSRETAEMFKS